MCRQLHCPQSPEDRAHSPIGDFSLPGSCFLFIALRDLESCESVGFSFSRPCEVHLLLGRLAPPSSSWRECFHSQQGPVLPLHSTPASLWSNDWFLNYCSWTPHSPINIILPKSSLGGKSWLLWCHTALLWDCLNHFGGSLPIGIAFRCKTLASKTSKSKSSCMAIFENQRCLNKWAVFFFF